MPALLSRRQDTTWVPWCDRRALRVSGPWPSWLSEHESAWPHSSVSKVAHCRRRLVLGWQCLSALGCCHGWQSFAIRLPRASPKAVELRGRERPRRGRGPTTKNRGAGQCVRRCALEFERRVPAPLWTTVSPRNRLQRPCCGRPKSESWVEARLDCRTCNRPCVNFNVGFGASGGVLRSIGGAIAAAGTCARGDVFMRPRQRLRLARSGAAPARARSARKSPRAGQRATATRRHRGSSARHCGRAAAHAARQQRTGCGSEASNHPGKREKCWESFSTR